MGVTPLRRLDCVQAQQNLPWYVNGTLDGVTRIAVEQHLTNCAECRSGLGLERRIATSLRDSGSDHGLDEHRAWKKFSAHIPLRRRRRLPWMQLVLLAQAATIAALTIVLLQRDAPPKALYRTVASTDEASLQARSFLRVTFAPQVAPAEAQRVVAALGLRVLSGPSAQNVYALGIDEWRTAEKATPGDHPRLELPLQRLRADPRVEFVQRISPEVGQ